MRVHLVRVGVVGEGGAQGQGQAQGDLHVRVHLAEQRIGISIGIGIGLERSRRGFGRRIEQPRHQLRLEAAHPEAARLKTPLEQRDGQPLELVSREAALATAIAALGWNVVGQNVVGGLGHGVK